MQQLSTGISTLNPQYNALPEPTKFVKEESEIATYFFNNNPWKTRNGAQKLFRCCIGCGDNRFSDEEWATITDRIWFGTPAFCNKGGCFDKLYNLTSLVPSKHYFIETLKDKWSVKRGKLDGVSREHFEEIKEVVPFSRNEKVFKNESEMPQQYIDTFKELEELPVEMRIEEIDSIYFKYRDKYKVQIGEYLTDTSDPFLQALADYRKKSIIILRKLESESTRDSVSINYVSKTFVPAGITVVSIKSANELQQTLTGRELIKELEKRFIPQNLTEKDELELVKEVFKDKVDGKETVELYQQYAEMYNYYITRKLTCESFLKYDVIRKILNIIEETLVRKKKYA